MTFNSRHRKKIQCIYIFFVIYTSSYMEKKTYSEVLISSLQSSKVR